MKQVKPIRALCESAVYLALAIVLSYVKFAQLPFEGAITLASMLPICIISIRFGIKWGLGAAFCYSWSQILQGGVFCLGLTPGMLIASLLLDYIVAFSVLGLAGMFRRHGVWGKIGGIVLACFLRFVVHFAAGVILWTEYEEFVAFGVEWVSRPVLYSICYNGVYMLPDTAICVAIAILLFKIPQVNKMMSPTTVKQ